MTEGSVTKAARAPAVDLDLIEKRIIVAIASQHDAERSAQRHEQLATSARETARNRRLEVGGLLADARKVWPERGPNAKGWGEFLTRINVSQSSAYRYMQEAADPDGYARAEASGETGTSGGGGASTDEETEAERAAAADVDRDTWCTPQWIADAIGKFDLDPCSNARSHIVSGSAFRLLERGEDGLERAPTIGGDWRVFVNPPYSDVMPWIAAYGHTRFCFLLKLDPSTKWFAALFALCELILIPRGTRVQFEPPPGVDGGSANPFPHALFYRRAADATPAITERCFVWRIPTLRAVD